MSEQEQKRLYRVFAKGILALVIFGLTNAGALLGFGVVLREQAKTSEKIQSQRYDNIYENCEEQNYRHDKAITKAKTILPVRAQSVVILIVDELQPFVQDCSLLAKSRVTGVPDK